MLHAPQLILVQHVQVDITWTLMIVNLAIHHALSVKLLKTLIASHVKMDITWMDRYVKFVTQPALNAKPPLHIVWSAMMDIT